MNTFLSFVIVLGVLIFFHELGHFLAARFCGVGVEKFSLGFGPRVLGKKIGRTDYRLSAIPLGGYVKMVGEEPDSEIPAEDIPFSFTHKSVYQRMLIVAAGPVFNIILALLIYFCLFQYYGSFIIEPVIGEVQENTPASSAGIMAGDRIVAIDDAEISTWDDIASHILASNGKQIEVAIKREGSLKNFSVYPVKKPGVDEFGGSIDRYVIGIVASGDIIEKDLNPAEAFYESLKQTARVTKLTAVAVAKIIGGSISKDNLGGPIMIAQMAGSEAKKGAANFLSFIAVISINLAILNFLPIPVLDGGHLMFFSIEAITKRPVSIRLREVGQQIGMSLLLLLMVFVFYNDIVRMLAGGSG